ncbi:MAG: hypothetical protein JXK07_10125 [Spirochaetes bacterium]|nr:hypothetical protein [Spirochaetota bacterium]MBN2771245.1 hypothetical protein [Spirochaetota bacterium]
MGNLIQSLWNLERQNAIDEARLAEEFKPKIRDGLYSKEFNNGITFVDGKPYTLQEICKTEQFILIEEGVPYLSNKRQQKLAKLIPVEQNVIVQAGREKCVKH